MIASELYARLSPFSQLCNRNALSPTYRSMFLSDSKVRGCAQFGAMECEVSLGINAEVVVDAEAFLQLLRSLPPSADLKLEVKENIIIWACGAARGRISGIPEAVDIPVLAWDPGNLKEVPKEFSKLLELGALSCGSTALLSLGMYGIQLDNKEGFTVSASDDATL